MRRTTFAALILFASAGVSFAHDFILAGPVILRAGPGLHFRYVLTAPPGAELTMLQGGRIWSRVSVDGRRGYVVTADLVGPPAPPRLPPPVDPNCDYGYPYSGSGQYFATPLNSIRHGQLFGALLGYHVRYPC